MAGDEIDDVVLQEPLTEFTAVVSVDIFDGNLFLQRTGWNGQRGFRVAIAGTPQDDSRNE